MKISKGVFYYVFFGTVSLIATILILIFGGAFTFFAANKAANPVEKEVRKRYLPPLTKEEEAIAKALLSKASIDKDDMEDTERIEFARKWNIDQEIKFYIVHLTKKRSPTLLIHFQRTGKEFIGLNRILMKIDDVSYDLAARNVKSSVFTHETVYEAVSFTATEHRDLVNALLNAKRVRVRLDGREANEDFDLTDTHLNDIKSIFLIYRHLGGEWEIP